MVKRDQRSPFIIPNVRLFVAFRATFNTRFYYPVFAILFLDFGLTLEQFAILNVAWAAAIVLLEVPSGALADVLGRKILLVFAGALMVAEMALLCFAPRANTQILFLLFLCNRILSGAAEAAASGADEAIAYDTLKKQGMEEEWPGVLERQMRVRAVASMVAMILGAAVYDPSLMQHVVDWLGLGIQLTQKVTLRFPLYLTLVMALWTLSITLRMREKDSVFDETCVSEEGCAKSIIDASILTLDAGRWIIYTPFAIVIIMAGLLFDSCLRVIITLTSQYYRLIRLPEATFGLIASFMSIVGIFIPRLSRRLVQQYSPAFNMTVMGVITLFGLTGMVFTLPIIGILPMVFVSCALFMNGFFESYYLNRITSSDRRATVLSFKGLSFNLAYGVTGLLYSFLLTFLRGQAAGEDPMLTGIKLENAVYGKSLVSFPLYFILASIAMVFFARWKLKEDKTWRSLSLSELHTFYDAVDYGNNEKREKSGKGEPGGHGNGHG